MTCKSAFRRAPWRNQRGVAAVELALLSILMVTILFSPILIARSLMQATQAQRAAYNAAHMVATYPFYQRLQTNPREEATAMFIAAIEASGMTPPDSENIDPSCTGSPNCRASQAPQLVQMYLSVDVLDPGAVLPSFRKVSVLIDSFDRYAN